MHAIPPAAVPLVPVLEAEIRAYWPQAPLPILAGQIEQETCPSLKHRFCWNPRAELKTDREYGFGLGQITVTRSFDNFAGAKALDPSLREWRWEERYRPELQLRTLVLTDRNLFRSIDADERIEMVLAAYNGGLGGLLKDRRMCDAAPDCDRRRWFGHVELHSWRAKTKVSGYGQSFFDINRAYVRNIITLRAPRYAAHPSPVAPD